MLSARLHEQGTAPPGGRRGALALVTRMSLLRKRLLRRPLEPAAEQADGVGSAMAYNFRVCDRDQAFLLPPDVRDWLPEDHLAWFVLDVVDQLDLGPFLKAYRADGHGRAAYAPRMLLAVLLYAYGTGVRSSRQIERRCQEDIAFRILSGNTTPDHVTIARFRSATSKPWLGCWSPRCSCARPLGWCAWAWSPWTAPRSRPTPPRPPTAPTPTSKPRSPSCSPRRLPPIRPRTASTARPAEASCPRRWPAGPSGWPGCNTPRPSWRPRPPPASSATSNASSS